MLKRGSKNAVFVRGDYKPAKLYKGTQLVAGWSPVTKAAPCAWDGTYNDVLDVNLAGKVSGYNESFSVNLFCPLGLIKTNDATGDILITDYRRSAEAQGNSWTTPGTANQNNGRIAEFPGNKILPGAYTIAFDVEVLDDQSTAAFTAVVMQSKNGSEYWGTEFSYTASGHYSFNSVTQYPIYFLMFTLNSSRIRVYNIMVVPQGTDTSVYVPWEVLAPTPTNFQQLIPSECGLTSKNADGSKTSTIVKSNALRKIPGSDVEDTYVVNSDGTVTITRNVKVVHLVGTENWSAGSNPFVDADGNTVGRMYFVWSSGIGEYNWNLYRWCDRYNCYPKESYTVGVSPRPMPDTGYGVYTNNPGYPSLVCFVVPSTDYASVSAWTNYLKAQNAAGTPVTLWVRAATPETETMSIADFELGVPTTVQLREVPEIGVRDTAKYLGSGKWEVTRNVAEVNLTDLSWSTVFEQLYTAVPNAAPDADSNAYTCKSNAFYGMTRNQIWYAGGSGTQNGFCLTGKDLRLVYPEKPTPTEFKTWLQEMATAGTPVIVWYQLKTPITEYLQLGELKTYPGYTALDVTGELLPDVTAGAKVSDTVL